MGWNRHSIRRLVEQQHSVLFHQSGDQRRRFVGYVNAVKVGAHRVLEEP